MQVILRSTSQDHRLLRAHAVLYVHTQTSTHARTHAHTHTHIYILTFLHGQIVVLTNVYLVSDLFVSLFLFLLTAVVGVWNDSIQLAFLWWGYQQSSKTSAYCRRGHCHGTPLLYHPFRLRKVYFSLKFSRWPPPRMPRKSSSSSLEWIRPLLSRRLQKEESATCGRLLQYKCTRTPR